MSDAPPPITAAMVAAATTLLGLEFTDAERELMLEGLQEQRDQYAQLRTVDLPNHLVPAVAFQPQVAVIAATDVRPPFGAASPDDLPKTERPPTVEAAAFFSVEQLAALLHTRQISAVELTTMYLDRLQRHAPALHCVVTLTPELALQQAQQADAALAAGRWLGPLHGIPWGAKDLLAVQGYPTTWGTAPYQTQHIAHDATVVQRLAAAGAVLTSKLSVGELAWGDVWFGGKTRNPWDMEVGSSGSSAGSASATAAGLVGFSLGTETHGSIVSPSTVCGVTGLRPTFGRVSRSGAMSLSWSMDKIGPICRTVADCALVFAAIYGPDGLDASVVDAPFAWHGAASLAGRRIGYVRAAFEQTYAGNALDLQALDVLRGLGAELVEIALPALPIDALSIILTAEAAAAFDDLTRSGRDDLMARQEVHAWPNRFRQARLITAVEYLQANRVRTLAMQAMHAIFQQIDVYVAPSFAGDNLLLTNLTGHPAVVVPNGRLADGSWQSMTFTGRLYGEQALLEAAHAYQTATNFHQHHPTL